MRYRRDNHPKVVCVGCDNCPDTGKRVHECECGECDSTHLCFDCAEYASYDRMYPACT